MRSFVVFVAMVTACSRQSEPSPHAPSPSRVSHPVAEGDIATVHFTADAIRRLGIETGRVENASVQATRVIGGEVVVPPGRTLAIVAPVSGVVRGVGRTLLTPGTTVRRGDVLMRLVPIAPVDRDVRARAEREVAVAGAQLEAADARVARIEQLLAERAGSPRAYEEAVATRDVARADVAVAESRARTTQRAPLLSDVALTVRAPVDGIVRSLSVAPDQVVASGAMLLEIVVVTSLQVRVPVYSGDLARVDATALVHVGALGASHETTDATPIAGPPTSDPDRATIDRYYALAQGATFSPGERVLVSLRLRETDSARALPFASVVYDAHGGAWAYACAGDAAFTRVRIDPLRREGDRMVITHGPALGTCVASVGAAEIFGAEFPPGH